MVVSEQLPYYRGHARQRGRGFGALAQTLGRTAIPFIAKYILPAAKRVGADLLELAAPEIGDVLTGKKQFKSVARDVGKKTLRKQIGGGVKRKITRPIKRKQTSYKQKRTKNSRSRRDIFTNITK